MAFHDMRKVTGKMGYKSNSSGPWNEGNSEDELNEYGGIGETGACGHYDEELDKFGNCRDKDCRKERMANALRTGEAMRAENGTIIWVHGHKIAK